MVAENPVNYFVKLFLTGIRDPFVFKVEKEQSDRVNIELQSASSTGRCVVFDTVDDRTVAVSIADIQAAHFLVDVGTYATSKDDDEPDPIGVYLRGRNEPILAGSEDPEGLNQLLDDLEGPADPSGAEFTSFVDEDGEELVIRYDQLVCMIVPCELLEDEDEEELPTSE
jgi:hypothetical protein